jgi:hypothetical protein
VTFGDQRPSRTSLIAATLSEELGYEGLSRTDQSGANRKGGIGSEVDHFQAKPEVDDGDEEDRKAERGRLSKAWALMQKVDCAYCWRR